MNKSLFQNTGWIQIKLLFSNWNEDTCKNNDQRTSIGKWWKVSNLGEHVQFKSLDSGHKQSRLKRFDELILERAKIQMIFEALDTYTRIEIINWPYGIVSNKWFGRIQKLGQLGINRKIYATSITTG